MKLEQIIDAQKPQLEIYKIPENDYLIWFFSSACLIEIYQELPGIPYNEYGP